MENLNLTDNAISHVAKLIQVAILTGTDIVDNLRMVQFVNTNGQLDISPDYHEAFNSNITRMMEEANTAAEAVEAEEAEEEYVTVPIPASAVTVQTIDFGSADNEE